VPLRVFPEMDQDAPFVDTAAIMQNLDLIITSDSAVAHLAGALGRPTWVMISTDSDWRWLIDRTDSPWYPTMRLFRQKTLGDWPGVFEQVAQVLREKAAKKD
jgi:ADP-heptose:LPS heptosyltransferase